MSASLEQVHDEQGHGLAPHVKISRARAGVLMLILSDALSVIAVLAGGGYLSALNTEGMFKVSGDKAPAFLPGLLVAIALLLSALLYYWWERRIRKSSWGGHSVVAIIAWVFLLAALVGQIWAGLILGYGAPFQAYQSVILLVTWYTVVHLLLAVLIGILLLGRVLRNRVSRDGDDYVTEVTGYWWYYTVVASLVMWIFVLLF